MVTGWYTIFSVMGVSAGVSGMQVYSSGTDEFLTSRKRNCGDKNKNKIYHSEKICTKNFHPQNRDTLVGSELEFDIFIFI